MKITTLFNEITISLIFVGLAILFLDPFMIVMPQTIIYFLLIVMTVLFTLFAGFIWKEHARDERDELHKMIAARMGYLLGAGVLVLGLISQSLFSHPDPWLIIALVAMVLGKLMGRHYSRLRH